MSRAYNPAHTGVRRIMQEAREMAAIAALPDAEFSAGPLADDDLFEWHFTLRGPPDSPFAGGLYHGRILLPANYPFKPPDIMLLTPSGRFETGRKICISVTSFHPEQWQPSWGIRLLLTALRAFMITEAKGAIGGIDDCPDERRADLALKSQSWVCPQCAKANAEILPVEDVKPWRERVAAASESAASASESAASAERPVTGRAAAVAANMEAGANAAQAAPAGVGNVDAGAAVRQLAEVAAIPPREAVPAAAPVIDGGMRQRAQAVVVAPVVAANLNGQVDLRETPTIDAIMSLIFVTIVVLLVRKLFAPDAVL